MYEIKHIQSIPTRTGGEQIHTNQQNASDSSVTALIFLDKTPLHGMTVSCSMSFGTCIIRRNPDDASRKRIPFEQLSAGFNTHVTIWYAQSAEWKIY